MTAVPQLLVHDRRDNVGVVVVENLAAGTEALGVTVADDSDFRLTVTDSMPIGHKVALVDFAIDDTVIKYGEDIGRIVAPVGRGGHVHVHNLKTKRW